jgi:UPF0755 protein
MDVRTLRFLRAFGKISVICSPILIAAFVSYLFMKDLVLSPADPESTTTELFEVAPGLSFRQAAKLLQERGFVKRWWSLDVISRIKGNNVIGAGEYELAKSMTPAEILNIMLEGRVFYRKFTFKEGETIFSLGKLVEEAGLLSEQQFNLTLFDPKFITGAGLGGKGFEGYLFPDTYQFSKPVNADDIIFAMLKNGEKKWKVEYDERAANMGWDRHQVLTMASIIEKESGNSEEQPTISSVFHNRLTAGWPLQSDPTSVYGIANFEGPILRKHLEQEHPYNTYKIKGLPPGPICNPGESAIKAVMYPASSGYMYFVSDGKGGHVFSATMKEHERAVEFYRMSQRRAEETRELEKLNKVGTQLSVIGPPSPAAQ